MDTELIQALFIQHQKESLGCVELLWINMKPCLPPHLSQRLGGRRREGSDPEPTPDPADNSITRKHHPHLSPLSAFPSLR